MLAGLDLEQVLLGLTAVAGIFGSGYMLYSGMSRDMTERITGLEKRHEDLERRITKLADEVHTAYTPREDLAKLRVEIRDEFREVKRDFGLVFDALNDVKQSMARYVAIQEQRGKA